MTCRRSHKKPTYQGRGVSYRNSKGVGEVDMGLDKVRYLLPRRPEKLTNTKVCKISYYGTTYRESM